MNYYFKYYEDGYKGCSIWETTEDLTKEREIFTSTPHGKVMEPENVWNDFDHTDIYECLETGTKIMILTKEEAFLEML